jgi:hypothetical protein
LGNEMVSNNCSLKKEKVHCKATEKPRPLKKNSFSITMLIEAEGARLLREKRGQGRPRRSASDEEAPGPPAESE